MRFGAKAAGWEMLEQGTARARAKKRDRDHGRVSVSGMLHGCIESAVGTVQYFIEGRRQAGMARTSMLRLGALEAGRRTGRIRMQGD